MLALVGEVDFETVAAYQRRHVETTEIVAVDLTEVSFLSSSAVSFVIRQTQAARDRGQRPVIRGVSAPARRVLELVGAIQLFAVPAWAATSYRDGLRRLLPKNPAGAKLNCQRNSVGAEGPQEDAVSCSGSRLGGEQAQGRRAPQV